MASEPTPKREQIQAAYDEWQAGATVDTAGRVARYVPYLLQRVRNLELAYAAGLESKRLSLLPDTEREVQISELEMKIESLEAKLAECDDELSEIDAALDSVTKCVAKTRAERIRDSFEHRDLVTDAVVFDCEKQEQSARTQVVYWMGMAKVAADKLSEAQADSERLDWLEDTPDMKGACSSCIQLGYGFNERDIPLRQAIDAARAKEDTQ